MIGKKAFSLIWVAIIFFILWLNAPATNFIKEDINIEFNKGTLSVDIKDTDTKTVFKILEEKGKIEIFNKKILPDKKVSVKFKDLKIEEGIKRLMRVCSIRNYLIVFREEVKPGESKVAKLILIKAEASSLPEAEKKAGIPRKEIGEAQREAIIKTITPMLNELDEETRQAITRDIMKGKVEVRTTEEFLWVGTCKLPDGSTPWNIPWKLWAYTFSETDGKVKAGGIAVKELFLSLVKRTFPEGSILVLMCRSGHRSTFAAEYLEEQLGEGYYTIYEIDNPLKNAENGKGGSGGFQGSSSVDPNDKGYRGYPERLPFCSETTEHPCVARYGSEIGDANDSVSWMDTGLPITQTVDKDKIWLYMGE